MALGCGNWVAVGVGLRVAEMSVEVGDLLIGEVVLTTFGDGVNAIERHVGFVVKIAFDESVSAKEFETTLAAEGCEDEVVLLEGDEGLRLKAIDELKRDGA